MCCDGGVRLLFDSNTYIIIRTLAIYSREAEPTTACEAVAVGAGQTRGVVETRSVAAGTHRVGGQLRVIEFKEIFIEPLKLS